MSSARCVHALPDDFLLIFLFILSNTLVYLPCCVDKILLLARCAVSVLCGVSEYVMRMKNVWSTTDLEYLTDQSYT